MDAIYHERVLILDAVILMGGRAERLGGAAKGDLRVGGRTLLERVVAAADVARDRVVVGESGASVLPSGVRVVREEPPFGGPAAAVAAGVRDLPADGDAVLLLAGDQPFVAVPSVSSPSEWSTSLPWMSVKLPSVIPALAETV